MESWYSEAVGVPSLESEVCFQLQPHFYYGPDRPNDIEDLHRLVEPLAPPKIQRSVSSMLRTSEAIGHEDQLVAYYEQIVRLAEKHKRPFNSIRHHFWLRFWLWNTEHGIHISFPWYDSYSEIGSFIQALASVESGPVHHDRDQGWEMEVHSQEGVLYFRERDPDAGETRLTIHTPRQTLLAELASLQSRTVSMIRVLSEALGADVWTTYVRNEPAFRTKRRRWWSW